MNHKYNEAYCLMTYRAADGYEEYIWNSRDGVAPFGYADPEHGDMRHVDWHKDQRKVAHVPEVGDFIWVDLSYQRAYEHRLGHVSVNWGEMQHDPFFEGMDIQQAAATLAKGDVEYGGGGAPHLTYVTPEIQAIFKRRAEEIALWQVGV
jgi:hypothetical protein